MKRAADTRTTRSSANGWNCCWIRRCWPSAARWKIEPVYPPYEPAAGFLTRT
nr:hypothetical protein [Klebsiella pneumoniae subsp. pneumoniae]